MSAEKPKYAEGGIVHPSTASGPMFLLEDDECLLAVRDGSWQCVRGHLVHGEVGNSMIGLPYGDLLGSLMSALEKTIDPQ